MDSVQVRAAVKNALQMHGQALLTCAKLLGLLTVMCELWRSLTAEAGHGRESVPRPAS